jgi:hypothetical protein
MRSATVTACPASSRSSHSDELIAPESSQRVAVAQRAIQTLRDANQQLVAGVVPEVVVDHLEAVQVDEQHGGHCSLATGFGDRLRDSVVQQGAVRQPGERVMQRPVA